jgi:NADH-quinone oxidoreductase subunit C
VDDVLEALVARSGGGLTLERAQGPETHLRATADQLRQAIAALVDAGYGMFVDLFAVDYPERPLRFEVVYHLAAPADARRVFVHAACSEAWPHLPSVADLLPGANWPEREAYDMFGVVFDGHPDLRRLLLPDDWEGHPLRKDYPTRGTRPLAPIQQT